MLGFKLRNREHYPSPTPLNSAGREWTDTRTTRLVRSRDAAVFDASLTIAVLSLALYSSCGAVISTNCWMVANLVLVL